jgi:hypothetical protein
VIVGILWFTYEPKPVSLFLIMDHGSWIMAGGWWLVAGGWWVMGER